MVGVMNLDDFVFSRVDFFVLIVALLAIVLLIHMNQRIQCMSLVVFQCHLGYVCLL